MNSLRLWDMLTGKTDRLVTSSAIRSNLAGSLPAIAPNGAPVEYNLDDVLGSLTVEKLWRTQPHLRTVVSFKARNIAQLGMHTFERVSDTDRRRVRDSTAAKLLSDPNEYQTGYDLFFSLVSDRSLYGEAIWWPTRDDSRPSGWRIDPISPAWVTARGGGSIWSPGWYEIQARTDSKPKRVQASDLIIFHDYTPGSSDPTSPVEALRATIAEQIHALVYRQQVWQRGGRVGDVLVRPVGAPEWSDEARKRFSRDWKEKWTGDDGPQAGGTPILEDGMDLKKVRFSAREEEWVEATKLALATVAQVYHINPTMIGLLDDANYSNVREFRKMLYGDTLGPDIVSIGSIVNSRLLPMVGEPDSNYAEFNIEEKLRGNFEEQTQAMSTAVGAPWMSRNEGRALRNLPAIDGGDELVTPLNVLIGGQASPSDSGSQNVASGGSRTKSAPVRFKSSNLVTDGYAAKAAEILSSHFARQRKAVLSALGAKAAGDWWDEGRWNDELAADLFKMAVTAAAGMGRQQAEAMGFSADDYDVDMTIAFLRSVAESRSKAVNAKTRAEIEEALESAEPDVANVFDVAESSRTKSASGAFVAAVAGFALVESAKQLTGDRARKEWVVNSSNPRREHAAMAGESVGIDDTFSNGAAWPGDPVLGADGVAGCQCTVDVILP